MSGYAEPLPHGFIEHQVPFCKPFVCSNSNQSHSSSSETALWECMPDCCQRNLIGFITVIIVFSVLTTIFNAAVLVINLTPSTRRVFRRNPTMRNYSNYVLSLSCTDLLIGAVVLPLAISFIFQELFVGRAPKKFQQQETHYSDVDRSEQKAENSTSTPNSSTEFHMGTPNATLVTSEKLQQRFSEDFDWSLEKVDTMICVLGFFTQFCVFVSMYTLTAASVDRYYVSRKATGNTTIRLSR